MTKQKGKFIVVEGSDGSGKSTLVRLIKEHWSDVIVTREPGGAPFAEKIRSVILSADAKEADRKTQFGLFWAARADHIKTTIIPAIEKGLTIVSDRFDGSSFAYQIYGQENQKLKDLFMHVRECYLDGASPDLYVFLDVAPAEGQRRRAKERGYDINHLDERTIDFYERVRQGYFDFLKFVPHVIVDANQPIEKVKKDFIRVLSDFLKK